MYDAEHPLSMGMFTSVEQVPTLGPDQNGSVISEETPVPPPRRKRKKKSSLENLTEVCNIMVSIIIIMHI